MSISGDNFSKIEEKIMNSELDIIRNWIKFNKLKLVKFKFFF